MRDDSPDATMTRRSHLSSFLAAVVVALAAAGALRGADTPVSGWSYWLIGDAWREHRVDAVPVGATPGRARAVLRAIPGNLAVAAGGVSVDGRYLVAARRQRRRSDVVLATATNEASLTLLQSTTRRFTAPVFARGNESVAVSRIGRGECGDRQAALVLVDRVSAETTAIRLPATPRHARRNVLDEVVGASPDGGHVAVSRVYAGTGCERLLDIAGWSGILVDVASRRVREITSEPLREAKWSPDGTRLAYTVGTTGGCALYVARGDGSRRRTVRSTERAWDPRLNCWSRLPFEWTARNQLLFTAGQALYAFHPDARGPRRLFLSPRPIRAGCAFVEGCPAEVFGVGSHSGQVLVIAKPGQRDERWFLVDPVTRSAETIAKPRVRGGRLLAVRLP
ncbi:MAG: hypothetical protein ICV59_01590 [Thermoleophilia bacterium]|nr:hypothetical protein [Thermoleophilia bacterium]